MISVPEILFDPSLAGIDSHGIDSIVHYSIGRCDVPDRYELY